MSLMKITSPFGGILDVLDFPSTLWKNRLFNQENGGLVVPAVEVHEDDNQYLISAEIPGVKKEDIHVKVSNGMLTIQASKKTEEERKSKKMHFSERTYGEVTRSFSLPDDADENSVDAKCADGVLNLTVKKTAPSKPREISVTVK